MTNQNNSNCERKKLRLKHHIKNVITQIVKKRKKYIDIFLKIFWSDKLKIMCIKITLEETLTLTYWQNSKTDIVTKLEKLGSKKT